MSIENDYPTERNVTMNRNEIIAKMAVIGCLRTPKAQVAEECLKCEFQNSCNPYRHAQLLYDAGYQQPIVHAHWTRVNDTESVYRCDGKDGCGWCIRITRGTLIDNDIDFCPHCGAKMDEENK